MSKHNSEHIWIEAGYDQFAAEGLEGLQVERLARITRLNKSGFYHYYGDRDTYLEKLMDHHLKIAAQYTHELKQVQNFDPEYINLIIKYKTPMRFSTHLILNRHVKQFQRTQELVNQMVDPVLSKLFSDFIGFSDHLEFSAKYFNQVRYMFHARITPEDMTYPRLRDFLYEAREVIQRAVELAASSQHAS